jgi:hypothetical protein
VVKDTRKAYKRLLKLITQDEKSALAKQLNLPETAKSSEMITAMSSLPNYKVLRLFLEAAESTLVMFQDIFAVLDELSTSVRTTGCLFILSDPIDKEHIIELEFSPQSVGMICDFANRKNWKANDDDVDSLKRRWQEFQPIWRSLIQKAKPRSTGGGLDLVRSALEKREVSKSKRVRINKDAQAALEHFLSKVEVIYDKLTNIPDSAIPEYIEWIVDDMGALIQRCRQDLNTDYTYSQKNNKTNPPQIYLLEHYTSQTFIDNFDKFTEDIYQLADLLEGEQLLDLLRIDLWSSRPQLFEVWILTNIMQWFLTSGYNVKILQEQKTGDANILRWNLSYSRDSKPCAVISAPDGKSMYLFFQLYRPSGDMPDIALLESPQPGSKPIWSIDPKHSEKFGYKYGQYKSTALRYKNSFGANTSIIAEYFARNDIAQNNPIDFAENAFLIHDCNSKDSGLSILHTKLSSIHKIASKQLICFDCSSSYSSRLQTAASELRAQCNESAHSDHLYGSYICFAGNSVTVPSIDKWLVNGALTRHEVEDGVNSPALLNSITAVTTSHSISKVIILTDGQFEMPIEEFVEEVENRTKAQVEVRF